MALQKSVQTPYGANTNATYWRIVNFNWDIASEEVTGVVAGYVDKASRDAGASAIASKTFSIDRVTAEPSRASIYAHLKTLEAFNGSTDV